MSVTLSINHLSGRKTDSAPERRSTIFCTPAALMAATGSPPRPLPRVLPRPRPRVAAACFFRNCGLLCAVLSSPHEGAQSCRSCSTLASLPLIQRSPLPLLEVPLQQQVHLVGFGAGSGLFLL